MFSDNWKSQRITIFALSFSVFAATDLQRAQAQSTWNSESGGEPGCVLEFRQALGMAFDALELLAAFKPLYHDQQAYIDDLIDEREDLLASSGCVTYACFYDVASEAEQRHMVWLDQALGDILIAVTDEVSTHQLNEVSDILLTLDECELGFKRQVFGADSLRQVRAIPVPGSSSSTDTHASTGPGSEIDPCKQAHRQRKSLRKGLSASTDKLVEELDSADADLAQAEDILNDIVENEDTYSRSEKVGLMNDATTILWRAQISLNKASGISANIRSTNAALRQLASYIRRYCLDTKGTNQQ